MKFTWKKIAAIGIAVVITMGTTLNVLAWSGTASGHGTFLGTQSMNTAVSATQSEWVSNRAVYKQTVADAETKMYTTSSTTTYMRTDMRFITKDNLGNTTYGAYTIGNAKGVNASNCSTVFSTNSITTTLPEYEGEVTQIETLGYARSGSSGTFTMVTRVFVYVK